MGIKPLSECRKGDIERSSFKPEIPEFEVLVERSSTNKDSITITLWKNEGDKFQVGIVHVGKPPETIIAYKEYEEEALPWALYEGCCAAHGCSPYPKQRLITEGPQ